MNKSSASGALSTSTVTVLSVSPTASDHTTLRAILEQSERLVGAGPKWTISPCATIGSAMAALRDVEIPLLVAERDLAPGSWRDILKKILVLPDPPYLIVTSVVADEYLWAEALNLGAYDVLAKPFDPSEVIRTLSSAWRNWLDRHTHIQYRNSQMMVATGAA